MNLYIYIFFQRGKGNNVKTLEVYNVKTLEVYNIKTLEVYNVKLTRGDVRVNPI